MGEFDDDGFEAECRSLWREVYARIAAAGSGGPRAKEYADNAVLRYRETWEHLPK